MSEFEQALLEVLGRIAENLERIEYDTTSISTSMTTIATAG